MTIFILWRLVMVPSVDSAGKVLYKSTNTSETRETDATLYRKTYAKVA